MLSILQQFQTLLRRGLPLPSRAHPEPPSTSLQVESLEDRCVPATIAWNGPAGGNWNNGSNWIGGVAPTTSDSAVIGSGSSVVITDVEAVHDVSLAQTASLDIQGTAPVLTVQGTFLDQGNLNVDGTLSMAAGSTMQISGDLAITGSGTFSSAGTVEVTNNSQLGLEVGAVNSNGGVMTFALDSASSSIDLTGGNPNATVEYTGAFVASGPGGIFLDNGVIQVSDFESANSASFDFTNAGGLSWSGGQIGNFAGGTFTNLGEMVLTGFGGAISDIKFDNQGQMVLTSGTEMFDASEGSALTNEGTIIETDGGQADIGVPFTNNATGTVEVDNGSVLSFDNNVENTGTVEADNGSVLSFNSNVENLQFVEPQEPGPTGPTNIDFDATTALVGGTWIMRNAQIQFSPEDFGESDFGIGTNEATIVLDGPNAELEVNFFGEGTASPLTSLTFNDGSLSLLNGAVLNDFFDFQNSGTLFVGNSAILNLTEQPPQPDGGFFQTPTGTLTIQIGGSSASGLFGQIQATQPSFLDGTLIASLENGYTPTASDVYPIIVAPTLTGTFATTQVSPLLSQTSDTTYFLVGTSASAPVLVVPPTPTPPLVVPPAPPNNSPSGGGTTSVSTPTDGPSSSDVTGSTAENGGGSGGLQETTHEASPLTSGDNVALYFQNLQWSMEVRTSDLSSMLGPTSAYTTPPVGEGSKSKSSDGNVNALPPILRYFIAAAGVGPANIMTSVNDGYTNVDQVYSILNPGNIDALGGAPPALPKTNGTPAPARNAPTPVRDSGVSADGAARIGEPEESEGMARMLAVFSLALYHACASFIPARSPTARGAAISSSWRSAR